MGVAFPANKHYKNPESSATWKINKGILLIVQSGFGKSATYKSIKFINAGMIIIIWYKNDIRDRFQPM